MASLLEVGTGFHSELTGRENIYLNGAIMGMTKREITSKLEEIVDFSGCARYIDTPIKRYSSGMTVRLGFAVAAFLEPEILIVDEVLAVGDAEFQKKAIGKMQEVSKGEGRTVIFVSHNMDTINNLCSTAIVLDSGALKFSGNTKLAIEFYGNKSKAIINNNFTSNYEPYQSSLYFKEIKVYQDQMIDFSFSTNDPLVFELTLISMISLNNFRIGIRIVNQYDLPVGLFYTDELLSINKFQKQKIRIELKNHNISKGIYFVDFSVGTGNEQNYPLDFFVMEKVISFEISKLFSNSDLIIPTWNEKNWGNINFRDYETKIIENETF
jgi:lipopolysaccharide transport system ATP-binding protein